MGINVLSLFDGISCGRIALERAGIEVDNYYASEIDQYPIKISKNNYPDIIHLGDVTKWSEWDIDMGSIDLVIGGSPCQGFSNAGKQLNFEDPRSKLFWEMNSIIKKVKSLNHNCRFLLENVKMDKMSRGVITEQLGVEPVEINSALVSAQNRKRYYWTDICKITQPEDKGLVISDILVKDSFTDYEFENEVKNLNYYSPRETKNYIQFDVSGKGHNSQQDRAYKVTGKFGCLPNARAITKRKIYIGMGDYTDLTLTECERLQTVPDDYTHLNEGFSLNKSLSALGNGWTVDVIAHIFKGFNA